MMDDAGKFVVRITLGVLMLLHGIAKIKGGVSGIEGMLTGAGMPGFFAWGAYVGEVLAPLLVIAGFYSRVGALLIVVNMLFAIGLAHAADLFQLGKAGGPDGGTGGQDERRDVIDCRNAGCNDKVKHDANQESWYAARCCSGSTKDSRSHRLKYPQVWNAKN